MAAVATAGCSAFGQAPPVQPTLPICARTVSETSSRVGENDATVQRPMNLAELLRAGDASRNEALEAQGAGGPFLLSRARLEAAQSCYGRALSLSPESYEASIGLGVVFLGLARAEASGGARQRTFVELAKRRLGAAYMIRRGAFEPLYYLAETAVVEKDYKTAETLLDELEKKRYRLGSVGALQGYVHEKTGNAALARLHYEMVVKEGWPAEAVQFALERLDQ